MNKHPMQFDHLFITKLESWSGVKSRFQDLFTNKELEFLYCTEKTFNISRRIIAFLSFENHFASLGGLAAVANHLPMWLKKKGEKVIFITPFHSKHPAIIKAVKTGELKELFKNVSFASGKFKAKVSCFQDTTAGIPSYHLKVKGYFESGENPYNNDPEKLLLDSLVFTSAVPIVLNKLGFKENVIFHAHDWETAPISLSSKYAVINGVLKNARTILTLHNSFDTALPQEYKILFYGKSFRGDTVLQCSIPMLNGPLTTVSAPFAHELRHDPLQRSVFTDHLQSTFMMNPPIGVENGMFGEPESPFSPSVLAKSVAGNHDSLLKNKEKFRIKFLEELESTNDSRCIGRIKFAEKNKTAPIFFMSGRLDFGQKGFDVIFNAFKKLKPGSAKLFFCPSSRNAGTDLGFFTEIEKKCHGDIVIWPFRISREQYKTFLQGSSFLLMPSFYEPFGAATEGFIHGTPVLARATGGLWVQVNPCIEIPVPTIYNKILKTDDQKPTGILFREKFADSSAAKNWRLILESDPRKRMRIPLYSAMVDAALESLKQAIKIYSDKTQYAHLITNGLEMVKTFSWETAVIKYKKIYDVTSLRGF